MLTLVDDHTRESPVIEVDTSLGGLRVCQFSSSSCFSRFASPLYIPLCRGYVRATRIKSRNGQ